MAEVLVLNDQAELNLRYRRALMAALESEGQTPRSVGIYKAGKPDFATLARLFLRLRNPVLASNLRANAVALLAFWTPGMVIVNGLGRFRQRKRLRALLLLLARLNLRKDMAFQSYADFRFFRRFGGPKRKHWVPGSGGSRREVGQGGLVAVQRDSKIALVADSLAGLMAALPEDRMLTVVGCTAEGPVGPLAHHPRVRLAGVVPQEALFTAGDTFVQPSGYGEGIPHTLVDALCSQMPVLIADIEYLRYGLHRLGATRQPVVPGWSLVTPTPSLAAQVGLDAITRAYMAILRPRLRA